MLVGRQKPHLVSPFERVTFVHVYFFWEGVMKGEVLAYVVIGCHPRLVHCFFSVQFSKMAKLLRPYQVCIKCAKQRSQVW